ncbi:g11840 [Coccomyxa viridis]|uniref:G11840 protein n=1 Tax=Coccomyxa viridis TaxID=1274662 RepID=A0ABP1GA16_9CHLO
MLANSTGLATKHCCFPVLSRRYRCTYTSSGRALHVVGHAAVQCPPADFDPRQTIRITSDKIVREQYPQLYDLAEQGVLTALPRPSDYVERRDDGYKEPEYVFVVGTAHFSEASADDVERVIEAVRPENVVVEVCRSRTAILYDQEPQGDGSTHAPQSNSMSLTGPSFLQALLRSARLGGNSAMVLRAVLSAQAGKVSQALGVRSGVEMRAARRSAERIGAQIVLGDRPIEITLQRAWQALTWPQRLRLLGLLLQSGPVDPSELNAQAVEALKDDDIITSVVAEYSEKFPQVVGPLLHERDLYLAWSLKRSKAVNGTKSVVGVIGRGHVRGVLYNLTTPNSSGLRFRDLVGSKAEREGGPSRRQRIARRIALELLLAAGAYFAWEAFRTRT